MTKTIDKTSRHPVTLIVTAVRWLLKVWLLYSIAVPVMIFLNKEVGLMIEGSEWRAVATIVGCWLVVWVINCFSFETSKTQTITYANGDKLITGYKCKFW